MIEVHVESYDSIVEDIKPLLLDHWRELAMFQDEIPLSVSWPMYKSAYDAGILRAYGVRQDGDLIGYAIFRIVMRHEHYDHRFAINDVLWIAPEHRNIGVGTDLCEAFERDLNADGPIVIVVETKLHSPALAMLLRARGYSILGPTLGKRFV